MCVLSLFDFRATVPICPWGKRGNIVRSTCWYVRNGCCCDYTYGNARVSSTQASRNQFNQFSNIMEELTALVFSSIAPDLSFRLSWIWDRCFSVKIYGSGLVTLPQVQSSGPTLRIWITMQMAFNLLAGILMMRISLEERDRSCHPDLVFKTWISLFMHAWSLLGRTVPLSPSLLEGVVNSGHIPSWLCGHGMCV